MRKLLKFFTSRFFAVSVLILIQACILLYSVFYISKSYAPIAAGFWVISFFIVFVIINKQSNPAVKLPWILIITLMPVFGGFLYVIFGSSKLKKKERNQLITENIIFQELYAMQPTAADLLQQTNPMAASQVSYIHTVTGIPLYTDTETTYFPCGEEMFCQLITELKKAQRYIFMEYFIVQPGVMWNTILAILKQKSAAGVDVRFIYDDVGSVSTLPYKYNEQLEKDGIHCLTFNPYRPTLKTILHNRDHRKICVIDGTTAFTGGINLADEYINRIVRFGHWKDSAIMMKGAAASAFALIFLELWGLYRGSDSDYSRYLPRNSETLMLEAKALSLPKLQDVPRENSEPQEIEPPTTNADTRSETAPQILAVQSAVDGAQTQVQHVGKTTTIENGFIQPYSDSPLDNEHIGELVYMNIINQCTKYLYITTPYLIVDNELVTALQLAAKRNVDVRIITPYIPDKWLVHELTRSYYEELIESGVHIYEYSPGFMHSKMFVADDCIATIGTINMDFRSLYHHFECGVWMYNTSAVDAIKRDILKTQELCREITQDYLQRTPVIKRIIRSVFKIFAPLM